MKCIHHHCFYGHCVMCGKPVFPDDENWVVKKRPANDGGHLVYCISNFFEKPCNCEKQSIDTKELSWFGKRIFHSVMTAQAKERLELWDDKKLGAKERQELKGILEYILDDLNKIETEAKE